MTPSDPEQGGSGAPALEAIGGWGRRPVRSGRVVRSERLTLPAGAAPLLPRGLGRAYGDAAVPASADGLVIETARADRVLEFDPTCGRLTCEAGLSLAEILRVFLPRGWFPPVTPGTKFVTVGGCVASDVHGKNHHRDGSFGRFVEGLRASAPGWAYTVGWIDCLARGGALGRGVLMRGRHASRDEAGGRPPGGRRTLRVPGDAPEWLLNPAFMRLFNCLYHARHGATGAQRLVSHERFFYPLDGLLDWNRLYGRRGFLQYQCVLPLAAGAAPVRGLLEKLAGRGAASFLAVIKDFGPASDAYLSFPLAGTTLSLDLPYRGRSSEELVHELNAAVIQAGGRVYLAKDAVTRAEDFALMMPRLAEWKAVRDRWDPHRRFRSAQSVRLLGDPA